MRYGRIVLNFLNFLKFVVEILTPKEEEKRASRIVTIQYCGGFWYYWDSGNGSM